LTASADSPIVWKGGTLDPESVHYGNKDERLGIDFLVTKLPFVGLQVMDTRLVTIAAGAYNE